MEMEMELMERAIPRPGRVPKQRLLSPELGFSMPAALRCVSGNFDGGSSVFTLLQLHTGLFSKDYKGERGQQKINTAEHVEQPFN